MNRTPSKYHFRFSAVLLMFLLLGLESISRAQEVWVEFTSPDKDFTVSLPGAPAHDSLVTPQKPFTGQKFEAYFYRNNSDSFNLIYKDLPAREGTPDTEMMLAEYERGLLVDGWLIVSKVPLPDGGRQYESLMDLPGGKITERRRARMQSRVYFCGRRMYTLSAMSKDAVTFTLEAPRFFASLRFLKPPPDPPVSRRQILSAKEAIAARGALKELRRLAAAESIAPSYDDYVKLLFAVTGEVDDYLADIRPGEVKEEIGLALAAYQDLQRAWNTTRGLLAMPVIGYEPQRTLILKYGIPIDRRGDMPLMDFEGAI
ncbi:MAG: hypothetical protein LC802_12405 [Acidobacteria bacterium]|nr:hypothetical protein [Acidobacteriota bacterium]